MKKKKIISPIHPTHSFSATKAATASHVVTNKPPIDRNFVLNTFATFAENMD